MTRPAWAVALRGTLAGLAAARPARSTARRACLSCAAAWGFLGGVLLTFAGSDRLLAHDADHWIPVALLAAGSIAISLSCWLMASIILEGEA